MIPCHPIGQAFRYRFLAIGQAGSLHAIGQVVRYRFLACHRAIQVVRYRFRTIGQAAVRYRSRAVGIATGHRSRVPSGSGGGSGLWGCIGSSVDRLYGQTPCHAKIDLYHIAHPG